MNIKVKFLGTEFWWMKDDDSPIGPIAPLEHCDETGELLEGSMLDYSFAQVYADGKIKRFGYVIGTIDDLELL